MSEKWVTTACDRCYVGCGIKVHVVDNVVVGMEGDPDNPLNRGKMCAKGKAGLMAHYNPNRVRAPLKRTNPKKGIGVDPQWQEISYEEAISTIAGKLDEIKDDPKKLYIYSWGFEWGLPTLGIAFGTPHVHYAAAHECGKSIHVIEDMAAGGFHQQPDLHYCNYAIFVGTQGGVATRGCFTHNANDLADARSRGLRTVVVDPIGGYGAAKADEWVPIRPGTDAAFALAFMNVLLNDLGIYDAPFLKKGTNGPYLIAEDGFYLRDTVSGKPMVYDLKDSVAKTFDDASIKDQALEGSYQVRSIRVTPAFELFKKHVAKYSPDWAEQITSVPAGTIRRLAKEFGSAVQVGSTIVLEGQEFPYRPAVVDWARGPQGHKHGFHHCWALKLINILVGGVNVPGGIISTGTMGKNPYSWAPRGGIDGMLTHVDLAGFIRYETPSSFPGQTPAKPQRMDGLELFPLAPHGTHTFAVVGSEPEKYGLDYKMEVAIHAPGNVLLSGYAEAKVAEKFLGSIPFVVGFTVDINETAEAYDDILIPMPSYLERQDSGGQLAFEGGHNVFSPAGQGDWYLQVRQKAVEPAPEGAKHPLEVTTDLAERLGILDAYNKVMNQTMKFKAPFMLDPKRKHTLDEVHDLTLKSMFGPDKGMAWAKEHGVVRIKRDVEEAYPGPYMTANNMRLPIYLEHFPRKGEELDEVLQSMGMSWDLSDYTPLPEYQPCNYVEEQRKGSFDLVGVHYKLAFTYGHYANENPWINEICERTPYTYPVLINEDIGMKKGIKDGDRIWLESPVAKARAVAKLTQCIHPEVVGIAGHFGHWAKGMPVSKGKGVAYNPLIPHNLDNIDKISTALDNCIPIRVSKAED